MSVIGKLKRDMAKHRGRAVILGVLFVAMVVLGVRAVLELRGPTPAAAAALPPGVGPIEATPAGMVVDGAQAQQRIQHSQDLWTVLRRVSPDAVAAEDAFTFDGAHYPTPAPVVNLSKPTGPAVVEVKPAPVPQIDELARRTARVFEEGRSLIIQSISLGNGVTEPMAIINQQLVTVGQKILGFEVVAIRSREVEFLKEGVTYVGKMSDGQ